MNRRAFLTGLFGTAAVAAFGPMPILEAKTSINWATWEAAVLQVYSDHFANLFIYGTAAIEHIDEFPFIRNVPLEELYPLPPTTGGLLS